MTERLSTWDPQNLEARGIPTDDLINLYKRWGEGDLGLILTGNIMIDFDQLEAAGNAVIPRDAKPEGKRFEAFSRLAAESKAHGSLIVVQVCHPGRQVESRIQKDPVSASDIQLKGKILGMTFEKPHAASREEIRGIVDGFAHTAEYLFKAGFDGMEVHAAHGFLLAQFLSPTTNKRTDEYGGNLENRSRLITEIAEAISARVPSSFILGIKINSVEFQGEGFDPDECKALCVRLEAHRFDFVELSGGTYEELAFSHKRESTRKREAFFLDFAEAIVPELTRTKTYVTGGFKTVGAMVNALTTVDGIGLARPVCQEPRLCTEILKGNVKGAVRQRVDENSYALTNMAAGTQLRMIGRDQEPIDLSQEENEKAFFEAMEKWNETLKHDTGFYSFGYFDVESVEPHPYGVAY